MCMLTTVFCCIHHDRFTSIIVTRSTSCYILLMSMKRGRSKDLKLKEIGVLLRDTLSGPTQELDSWCFGWKTVTLCKAHNALSLNSISSLGLHPVATCCNQDWELSIWSISSMVHLDWHFQSALFSSQFWTWEFKQSWDISICDGLDSLQHLSVTVCHCTL